jgi:hypothetical protein
VWRERHIVASPPGTVLGEERELCARVGRRVPGVDLESGRIVARDGVAVISRIGPRDAITGLVLTRRGRTRRDGRPQVLASLDELVRLLAGALGAEAVDPLAMQAEVTPVDPAPGRRHARVRFVSWMGPLGQPLGLAGDVVAVIEKHFGPPGADGLRRARGWTASLVTHRVPPSQVEWAELVASYDLESAADDFRARVDALVRAEGWVISGGDEPEPA